MKDTFYGIGYVQAAVLLSEGHDVCFVDIAEVRSIVLDVTEACLSI